MDGLTGFKTTSEAELPDAVEALDPFHVVNLAGDALDACRQRVQQEMAGNRGRSRDPLHTARRALCTSDQYLTNPQSDRVGDVLDKLEHAVVEATWIIYQRVLTAYREPNSKLGRSALQAVIDPLKSIVPSGLTELRKLGRTLNRRASDILAYFDHPGTSNGPTEAINGRLEHLHGIALGFRNLTNYIAYAEFRISDGMSTSGLC